MTTRTLLTGLSAVALAAATLLAPTADAQDRRPTRERPGNTPGDPGRTDPARPNTAPDRPGNPATRPGSGNSRRGPAGNTNTTPRQAGSPVTDEGFDELRYGKTFFLEVPMIDQRPLIPQDPSDTGGIGANITAESIINNVRYAGANPDIQHVVFMMRTGGGLMFHAEAMKDVIEEYHRNTEFHIIIDDAISAGTWTAFSCDSVFMIDGGSIGGAVIYVTLPDGSVRESPEIPFVAARMAKLAERNGHPGVLLPAMMHLPAELHYWEVDGEGILSDKAPDSPGSVQNYWLIDSDQDVLTLTSDEAIRIGLAEHIETFNADRVGNHIGAPGWTRANHYGQVVHEIGDAYNRTRALQDQFQAMKEGMPYVRNTRENRDNPQTAEILKQRQILETLLDAYEQINDALNNLPYVHPERHIYFAGEDGRTILADPEQWEEDVRESKAYARQLSSGLRDLRSAFRLMERDDSNLDDTEDAFDLIADRIDGIDRQGNAAYWMEHADDLPR